MSSISKPAWQKRDTGLTIRMIFSFAILTLLYLVFLSVLSYLGIGYIPIIIIASAMILAQWYFSDKIVLWSSGAKVLLLASVIHVAKGAGARVTRIDRKNCCKKQPTQTTHSRYRNKYAKCLCDWQRTEKFGDRGNEGFATNFGHRRA